MKRALSLADIVNSTPFLPASCETRDCLALKWLNPGLRPTSLPLFVSFRRLVNDLLVFVVAIICCRFAALIPLDNDGEPLGGLLVRFRYLIVFCHKMQDSVKPLFKEGFPHAFGAAAQEELHFDAVPLFEPVAGSLCLELKVVVAGANLDLDVLCFGGFCPCPRLLELFFLLVLVFAPLHEFGNRGLRLRGNLDEVYPFRFSKSKRFSERQDAAALSLGIDDAQLLSSYLFVDSFLQKIIVR